MYLIPLDQRLTWPSGVAETAKRAVYDGFRAGAAAVDVAVGDLGIVGDAASAAPILDDAASRGFLAVCRVEAEDDPCRARWAKLVVRYNPDADPQRNAAEIARAQQAALRLRQRQPSVKLIVDLVLLPTQWQIACGIRYYDEMIRPAATGAAVRVLLAAGLDPDVWVIEGFDVSASYAGALTAIRDRRDAVCLIRAAGHEDATTRRLMMASRGIEGVGGVVLPRAPFWEPVELWMGGRSSRREAVATVAARVRRWVSDIELSSPYRQAASWSGAQSASGARTA
jgi:hypothetical protein